MDIEGLRKKIDKVNLEILNSLNKRAELVEEVGKVKINSGRKDFYIPHREKKIISSLVKANKGPLEADGIEAIYREIINACRALESKLAIAYFGPEGTFTHLAAMKIFGSSGAYVPVKTIADVFTEVEKGRAGYGVVPVENSTEGVVNHTLDMFIESNLVICSELNMRIEECLLSVSGNIKDIKTVYSHYQPLAQCRNWLEENLPGIPVVEVASTAAASKRALSEKGAAAIGSRAAAEIYKLEIAAGGIEDSKENFTRFIVIGNNPSEASGEDKTSILFSIKDKVGALHDMLMPFKRRKINLAKIESRPTKKKAWEYIFFVDLLGHISDKKVQDAIDELEKNCMFLKVLGSYPKAD